MSFSEERLDLGYDYGTVATITTKTSIIESKNGTEQRTPQWYQPLLQFNIGERSEINDQLDQLIAFYQARKGAYQGFRFKDWSDYQFSTIITLDANKQAQLFKAYSVAGFTVKRPLIKIVPGSILVSVGNSPVTTGWTVNFNTGIITFDQVQTEPIQVSGEFDVPVRFATDKINLRFEAFEACEPESNLKLFSLENLSLTEIRINPTLALSLDQIPQSLDHQINLGYDYGTIGGVEFATKINQLVSGQEQRISEWATSRGSWEVGARTLIKSDLDYLISLFRVCRGKAVGFKYFDWQTESQINVRFGEDAIAFRFDAYEKGTEKVLFNFSGVPLVKLLERTTITVHVFGTYTIKPVGIGVNDPFSCGDVGYWRTWQPVEVTANSATQTDFSLSVPITAWTLNHKDQINEINLGPISFQDYTQSNTGNIIFFDSIFGALGSIFFRDTCGTGTNFTNLRDGDNLVITKIKLLD